MKKNIANHNRYLGLISLLIFSSRGGGSKIIIWKDNDKIIIRFV